MSNVWSSQETPINPADKSFWLLHEKGFMKTLLFIACIFVGSVFAQDKPGLEPYTPTKIEWLALVLNATYREDHLRENDGLSLTYIDLDHETILILVQH